MPDLDLSLNFEAVNAEISIPGIAGPRGPEGIVRTGELDSRYYSVNNPSGFITGINTANLVYNTGDQTISGFKTFANPAKFNAISGDFSLDISTAIDLTLRNRAGVSLELGGEEKTVTLSGDETVFYLTNLDIYSPTQIRGKLDGSTGIFQKLYAGNLVYNTGNQTISGAKTFADNIQVSGTGTFNALDLNNIDNLSLSGVDVTLTDSTINVNRNIFISGKPVLTGVDLSSYATTANLASTGNNLSFLKEDHVIETRSFHLQPFVTNYLSGGRNVYTSFTYNGALPSYEVRLPTTNTQTGDKLYLSLTTPSTSAVSVYISQPGAASLYTTVPVNTTLKQTFYVSAINFIGGTFPTWTPMKNIMGYLDFTDLGDINTKINSLSGTLTGNYAAITDSGINIIAGTYRVNNIPYNTFSINFLSNNANLIVGQNYISNVGAGYSNTFSDRSIPMFENCTARKASISLLNSGPGNNIAGITGYFINVSTNPPQTGIINLAISAPVGSNQYTYTGAFTTPINISFGDNVVCSLNSNIIATNVRTAASIYCYN